MTSQDYTSVQWERVSLLNGKTCTQVAQVYLAAKSDKVRSVIKRHIGFHAYVNNKPLWQRSMWQELLKAANNGDYEFIRARAIQDDEERKAALNAIKQRNAKLRMEFGKTKLKDTSTFSWNPPKIAANSDANSPDISIIKRRIDTPSHSLLTESKLRSASQTTNGTGTARNHMSRDHRQGKKLIFRRFRTCPWTGRVYDAFDYGYRAWPMWV